MSAEINMSWAPDSISANADSMAGATRFVNALSQSTVNVTLSDPYMTGAAWLVLFDTAAAFTGTAQASSRNILLPKCKEGQDPRRDNCTPVLREFEDPGERGGLFGSFAHLLVTLYYDVSGVKFSLETYFRVQGFDISHGKTYPQVTIRGVDPQTIAFNQNLKNFELQENKTLEEELARLIKDLGYTPSFCFPPDADYSQKYLFPKLFKEKGVTAEEVIGKYVRSVGGSYTKLPTKEFANKISICSRANVNQGCSVFYLGVGLYEGYNITGGVDPNPLNLNVESSTFDPTGIDATRERFTEQRYVLEDVAPERRREKLRNAKLNTAFVEQFTTSERRLSNGQTTTGFVWMETGPEVVNERKENINLYGVGVNGNKALALLDGTVRVTSQSGDRVVIQTNYFLRVCKKSAPGDCFTKIIFQESINITPDASLKVNDRVTIGQQIGTATAEKPEGVRLYLNGYTDSESVTLSPILVGKYAIPVERLTDEERARAGVQAQPQQTQAPSSPSAPSGGAGVYVGRIGTTGLSRGPHLHAEKVPPGPITARDLDGIITIGGKKPSEWTTTSGYGAFESFRRAPHQGVDIAGAGINNQPILLINGTVDSKSAEGYNDGFGNFTIVNTPIGKVRLSHLAPGSLRDVNAGQSAGSSNPSGARTGTQSAPSPLGAEVTTEFNGVPRALRIVPGRTVLSFVTKYDEWVEKGRPANIDPGVWIAGRFSKFIIRGVNYKWNQGNLRVGVRGVTDWGVTTANIKAPSFEEYMKLQTDLKYGKDYYNYIRSLGDLCWPTSSGKSSCEDICKEVEDIEQTLASRASQQQGQPGGDQGATSSFPPSDCRYTGDFQTSRTSTMNNIMAGLKAAGITNPVAYAGVLGNISVESSFNFNFHNSSDPGSGCGSTPSRVLGTTGYGLAQWCGSRADNLARKCDRNCSEQQQIEFIVQEIREGRDVNPAVVGAMNGARSPSEAADLWNQFYERGPGGIQKRREDAERIWKNGQGLTCSRIN